MRFPRTSGVLLHPTSLPGPFGIGDLGSAGQRFADFLVDAGQSLWQVLPLGPVGYGLSPYTSLSTFAGNTLLISPERLFERGLINKGDLEALAARCSDEVEFEKVSKAKEAVLNQAFMTYQETRDDHLRSDFEKFAEQNSWWLEDYALFQAIKNAQKGLPWNEWEPDLSRRDPTALARARDELRADIEAQRFYQFLFFDQWLGLKAYCSERGIRIIGDIPIFVAHDSVDVWASADQFKLDADGMPLVVAGVPPDYFSSTGQLWGNPIYKWERMLADGFRWWIERLRSALRVMDIARIDHFRGFSACWEIPAGDQTAERGQWVAAPGHELFKAMRQALGDVPIIAEDLGVITPEVEKLRDDFGFPGMRVLQFAFDGETKNVHLPHNYIANVVAYTGTHDNDTTCGWFHTRRTAEFDAEKKFCTKYLNTDGEQIHWDFIRAAWASVADTAIVPLQDVLGLGSEARMNLPNTNAGNWRWRFRNDALTETHSDRLRGLTETYGRNCSMAAKT